jgi:hypothetical protein
MEPTGGRAKSSSPQPNSITWTLPWACKILGVSETTGRDLARRGLFPGCFQVPGGVRRYLVHVATFEAQVAALGRGEQLQHDPDRVLNRALDEARARRVAG